MAGFTRPSRKARLFSIVSFAFFATLIGAPALASASLPHNETPPASEQFQFPIPEGKYVYRFAWNGIPSGESELLVTVQDKEDHPYYCFEGAARTSKFADIFWTLRASAVAFVDALSGRTLKINVQDRQNKKLKRTETVFNHDSSEAYYTRWKQGEVKQKTIPLRDGALDPASLCLLISRQEMQVGDAMNFVLLVGDDPYEVEYTVAARERITLSGCAFDTLRIEPSFSKMEDKGKNKKPKIDLMTLWVNESDPRIPLKMQSSTFVGHVTAELVSVEPLGRVAEQPARS
jgi:hypothetical protein